MQRMDMKMISGLYVLVTLCPPCWTDCATDTSRRAQHCLNDLANGVSAKDNDDNDNNNYAGRHGGDDGDGDDKGSGRGGSLPLDYRQIREYCAEDGYMPRFVRCVDNLTAQCPGAARDGVIRQHINPQRVRTSVPNLCNNVDAVEAGAECMNQEVRRHSPCKERAQHTLSRDMARPTANTTAISLLQCRFFSVLADCQRTTVSEACGSDLGDLHADFLLSFVPDLCHTNSLHDLHQGHQRPPGKLHQELHTDQGDSREHKDDPDTRGKAENKDWSHQNHVQTAGVFQDGSTTGGKVKINDKPVSHDGSSRQGRQHADRKGAQLDSSKSPADQDIPGIKSAFLHGYFESQVTDSQPSTGSHSPHPPAHSLGAAGGKQEVTSEKMTNLAPEKGRRKMSEPSGPTKVSVLSASSRPAYPVPFYWIGGVLFVLCAVASL